MIDMDLVKPGIIVYTHSKDEWDELMNAVQSLGAKPHSFSPEHPCCRLFVSMSGTVDWLRDTLHYYQNASEYRGMPILDFSEICIGPANAEAIISSMDTMFEEVF